MLLMLRKTKRRENLAFSLLYSEEHWDVEVLRAVFLNRQVSSGNFVKEVEHSLSVCGVKLVHCTSPF
nr:MAG TPA: hypothetical protein [Caudoviricetes sp.]